MFDRSPNISFSLFSLLRRIIKRIILGWKLFRSSYIATQTLLPHNTDHLPEFQPSLRKRKALLIGICSSRSPSKKRVAMAKEASTQNRPLKGPHNDVNDMRALLLDVYHYAADDITTLLDNEGPDHSQPTRANILKAIKELVKDAKPGDSFFFHFAGHSGQEPELREPPEEEDRMNEYIMTSDGKKILDDILYKRLVEPLPPNSTLTAVMDSCHSCSLLDLKHFRCNRVYVPWINRGKRRTMTLQYLMSRKQALFAAAEVPKGIRPLPSIGSVLASNPRFANAKSFSTKSAARNTSLFIKTNVPRNSDRGPDWMTPPVICTSPTPRFCEGHNCDQSTSTYERSLKADVICISSSGDEQKTWEDANGVSMTQIMIKKLRDDPRPTLHDLMSHICFTIYCAAYERNNQALQYKKDHRSWVASREKDILTRLAQPENTEIQMNGDSYAGPVESKAPQAKKPGKNKRAQSLEISNFQNPELSSHFPVDMKNRRWYI